MPSQSDTVTIIGAGLTGPLLAISLVQRGFRVAIYERRPDMRRVQLAAGRSINLAISVRGIHALREAGLWEFMRGIIIPMKGRMMHSLSGELTFQPYGKDETEVINSISRADLNVALVNAAESKGNRRRQHRGGVHFGAQISLLGYACLRVHRKGWQRLPRRLEKSSGCPSASNMR